MEEKHKYIQAEGWISIICNILLFAAKYWVGTITGSIAIIADAWHTLTDSVSSVIVIVGGKISKKPADEKHPFGHGRAEHIAAVIIGILLIVVAIDFFMAAINKLQERHSIIFGTWAYIITIISIFVKEAMAQYALWAYKKTGASILKADAWHHRTDSLSSIIILFGMLLGQYWWWIDGALAIVVALMIAHAAYGILTEEIKSLLGEDVDKELASNIRNALLEELNNDYMIHHMHIHRYGDHCEMSCHIKLQKDMPLHEVHRICSQIEKVLSGRFNIVTTVHPEPIEKS